MITVKYYDLWAMNAERRIKDAASRAKVSVGIRKGEAYPDGTKVSDIAFMQEFGDGNVPPRPFVRNAKKDNETSWRKDARDALSGVVSGDVAKADAMKEIGEKVKDGVVASLDALTAPELKPRTVAAKKRKGRAKPEKPLVDSGTLREAIGVEVVV